MEAHPPYHLPKGLHPSGLPACMCWGHLRAACQGGCTPLDSPLVGAALQLWGSDQPPGPLPSRKGEIIRSPGGHPQTPAKGGMPLWTPRLHVLGHILHAACQRGCTSLDSLLACAGAHLHAACQGGYARLDSLRACAGGHLHAACQRGCSPLDSPLARAGGHLHAACQWGCAPLDSPLARAESTTAPDCFAAARNDGRGGIAPRWTPSACMCGRWASRGPRRSAGGT